MKLFCLRGHCGQDGETVVEPGISSVVKAMITSEVGKAGVSSVSGVGESGVGVGVSGEGSHGGSGQRGGGGDHVDRGGVGVDRGEGGVLAGGGGLEGGVEGGLSGGDLLHVGEVLGGDGSGGAGGLDSGEDRSSGLDTVVDGPEP